MGGSVRCESCTPFFFLCSEINVKTLQMSENFINFAASYDNEQNSHRNTQLERSRYA